MRIPGKSGFQRAGSCLSLILILCASSNCGALEFGRNRNVDPSSSETNRNASNGNDTLFYLELSNPSITQPLKPDEGPGAKFVQVEVTEVVNPNKYPLSFEVRYQTGGGTKIYLGSFSLYPADHPGKFIVATQGKVKDEGAIILTMVVSDKVDSRDSIKVGVKKIRLLK